jgi:3-oxoacyl-[acyl-carrier protein] reductase
MLRANFTGKVCVVTGASRGIGRLLCTDFAADGGIVVGAARNIDALELLASEIRRVGGTFLAVQADLSLLADCERMVDQTLSQFGQIDVLVNNMGTTTAHKAIRELQPAEWQEAINTNLTSVYACIHFAVGSMMDRRTGAIVNVSSLATKVPSPKRVAYVATKMGIVGITRVLAHELGPYNITVNTVSPGFIDGERSQEVQEHMSKSLDMPIESVLQMLLARSPLGRSVPPGDVSAMIRYLASEFGRSITGQDIDVAAGMAF